MTREEFKQKYSQRIYLDDAVYAHFDGYHIILETINDDPNYPSNIIYLEPNVIESLLIYRESIYKDANEIEDDK